MATKTPLFKKFRATAAVVEYRQARDPQTQEFHIQVEEGKSLCGTRRALKAGWVVTEQEVMNSHKNGFHWCPGCGSAVTGQNREVFKAVRSRSQFASV